MSRSWQLFVRMMGALVSARRQLPRQHRPLAEGPHRIEVRKDGHRPYTTTVEIRRGETVTLNVSLPREE